MSELIPETSGVPEKPQSWTGGLDKAMKSLITELKQTENLPFSEETLPRERIAEVILESAILDRLVPKDSNIKKERKDAGKFVWDTKDENQDPRLDPHLYARLYYGFVLSKRSEHFTMDGSLVASFHNGIALLLKEFDMFTPDVYRNMTNLIRDSLQEKVKGLFEKYLESETKVTLRDIPADRKVVYKGAVGTVRISLCGGFVFEGISRDGHDKIYDSMNKKYFDLDPIDFLENFEFLENNYS